MSSAHTMTEGNHVQDEARLLELYRRTERAIGDPLERGVDTDEFAALLARLSQARVAARQGRDLAGGLLRGVTARALHLFNLPAASDLARHDELLLRLEREVRDLRRELDRAEERRQERGIGGRDGGE